MAEIKYEDINRIIIIGKSPSWEDAPMGGHTWGVNDLVLTRPVELTFEMHDIDKILKTKWRDNINAEIKEINRLGIPVVTREKHKLLPTSIPFPIDEMPVKYFTSSVAYMVAYAIYNQATAIDIYGVHCDDKGEFFYEKPCIEFWMGHAVGRGIAVAVYGATTLLTPPFKGLYGYDWTPGEIKWQSGQK